MEEDHEGGQAPHRVIRPVRKKKKRVEVEVFLANFNTGLKFCTRFGINPQKLCDSTQRLSQFESDVLQR
jgi:hypothetical protein